MDGIYVNYQVIQAVTKLYPRSLEVTETFEGEMIQFDECANIDGLARNEFSGFRNKSIP